MDEERSIADTERLLDRLASVGLLLQQDQTRDNIVRILTSETLGTPGWDHPLANHIFKVLEGVSEHPDITLCKLISGKVTFVHRRLWPSLYTVGASKEDWQLQSLTDDERHLLDRIESAGVVVNPGAPAKKLAKLLLVHTAQVHSSSGKHITVATSWDVWAGEHAITRIPVGEAKRILVDATFLIQGREQDLPWT